MLLFTGNNSGMSEKHTGFCAPCAAAKPTRAIMRSVKERQEEAVIVSRDHSARPPASSLGRLTRSASRPMGTSATAYR